MNMQDNIDNGTEDIELSINGWLKSPDCDLKTEILEGLHKELETGEKQIKQYNIDI